MKKIYKNEKLEKFTKINQKKKKHQGVTLHTFLYKQQQQ